MVEFTSVKIKKPDEVNIIFGQAHFIKAVEDIYEIIVNAVPGIKFGLAFVEASGACKVRSEGTDIELKQLAERNALTIGAGHSFLIMLKDAYPINILNAIKNIPEVCTVYCASANPIEVILAQSETGRGVLGIIDGLNPQGLESSEDKAWRHGLLRKIGYKL